LAANSEAEKKKKKGHGVAIENARLGATQYKKGGGANANTAASQKNKVTRKGSEQTPNRKTMQG